MRNMVARLRPSTVVTELLLVGSVVVVTLSLIDLMPMWGWSEALDSTPDVTVVCAAALVVLSRRALTMPALLGAAVLFGAFPETGVALAAAAYTAAGKLRTASRRLVALGAAALLPVGVVLLIHPPSHWRYVVVVTTVSTVMCVAIPALVGLSQAQQARLVTALRDRADFLAQARHLAESEARLRERSRIAGEIHDQLGHRLSLIAMFSGALETAATGKDQTLHEAANHVRTAARGALNELRLSLGTLSDGSPQATSTTGTRADITELVASSRSAGIAVTLDWRGPDLVDAPSALGRALHRVVREALTNVHKHAAAAPVTVTIDHSAEQLAVRVCNGPEPTRTVVERLPGTGRGLVGLRERVGLLGGTLSAGPAPEGGFAVAATMPVLGGTPLAVAEPFPRPRDPMPPDRMTSRLATGLLMVGGPAAVAGLLLVVVAVGAPLIPLIEDPPAEDPLVSLTLGVSSRDVEGVFGTSSPTAPATTVGEAPPPPGSTCTYAPATNGPEGQVVEVYRFCFVADRLVEKVSFPVQGPEG
ncbi:signal transduction histidine kinase [Kibdelosporangium banguiense]|uniref:histidine kinase n=1 Tax=Kibdelosporangium banguiense TaxID=1365924 RepID=A0ABS4TSN7_9PSEU|nr:histidine kinase [Kibdelosporangium banguiense]MBP2326906.1 signal transduction histidine kinase [Kibdelosporangium banguiense]